MDAVNSERMKKLNFAKSEEKWWYDSERFPQKSVEPNSSL